VAAKTRGSEALIREWGEKNRAVNPALLEAAAKLLADWKIVNIMTHGIPPYLARVVVEFEAEGASEDDYERCGNVIRGLGHLPPHGPGVPIELQILINGIPAIDVLRGQLVLGGAGE